jgi:hypothetical protein
MGANEGLGCDDDAKYARSGTVGERARATKASPASQPGAGLAPWGVLSDAATLEPSSPCEF